MRGDRPLLDEGNLCHIWFTPHARGSTLFDNLLFRIVLVYPACAGIDLKRHLHHLRRGCLPRMRGDRPSRLPRQPLPVGFTPHARGSTLSTKALVFAVVVYPACAGIDLISRASLLWVTSLPRMRGDRPPKGFLPSFLPSFTPHARGSTFVAYIVR